MAKFEGKQVGSSAEFFGSEDFTSMMDGIVAETDALNAPAVTSIKLRSEDTTPERIEHAVKLIQRAVLGFRGDEPLRISVHGEEAATTFKAILSDVARRLGNKVVITANSAARTVLEGKAGSSD